MARDNSPSGAVVIARLHWLMLGPVLLSFLALGIANRKSGWLAFMSLAYFGVLASVIVARWLEFRGGNSKTSTGETATVADFRRYVMGAIVVGTGVWIAASLFGGYALGR